MFASWYLKTQENLNICYFFVLLFYSKNIKLQNYQLQITGSKLDDNIDTCHMTNNHNYLVDQSDNGFVRNYQEGIDSPGFCLPVRISSWISDTNLLPPRYLRDISTLFDKHDSSWQINP